MQGQSKMMWKTKNSAREGSDGLWRAKSKILFISQENYAESRVIILIAPRSEAVSGNKPQGKKKKRSRQKRN